VKKIELLCHCVLFPDSDQINDSDLKVFILSAEEKTRKVRSMIDELKAKQSPSNRERSMYGFCGDCFRVECACECSGGRGSRGSKAPLTKCEEDLKAHIAFLANTCLEFNVDLDAEYKKSDFCKDCDLDKENCYCQSTCIYHLLECAESKCKGDEDEEHEMELFIL